ncbi:hypothetical protein LP109_05520 [Moraxella bovis]|uniref:hypothetical protein n=1 Tax=Moraxella bovis TaxID=476 RepID=UPI0009947EBC|nr:hypothetical protein [Moraxella bovis]OOR87004.1 hypothetical protein B0182_13440 [Moraxella bovis]UZA17741.1 hypothetical protein LP109_05520 [Moraxella bovis]
MDVIQEAEIWLIDNGILPSSVQYNIYTQKQVLKYPNAVAVLGVGKTRHGNNIGFAIEVVQGQGVVYGGILEPDGVAMWGKKGLMRTITENKLLIDVMQEMAQEHRTALAYYERIANEKGISLMEAMQKYPLPEHQKSSTPSRSAEQTPPEPAPIRQTPPKQQSVVVDDEPDEQQGESHSKVWDWLAWGLFGCVAVILGVPALGGSVSSTMLEVMIPALGLIVLPLLIALIWYVFKSIYTMFQYSNLWGILGVATVIFGFYPLLAGVFYFTYELEDEDKTIFKRLFMSCFMVVFIGIGSAIVLPALSDNKQVESASSYEGSHSDIENLRVSDDELYAVLESEIVEIKPTLPVKVDNETFIVDIQLDKAMRRINYISRFSRNKDELLLSDEYFQKRKQSVFVSNDDNFCQNEAVKQTLVNGIEMRYVYYSNDGYQIGKYNITRQDCGY